ncbi:hypothetical protein VPH35_066098 [Triticum aestivum]
MSHAPDRLASPPAPCSPPAHPISIHRATSPPIAEDGGLGLQLEEVSTCIYRWMAVGGYSFRRYSTGQSVAAHQHSRVPVLASISNFAVLRVKPIFHLPTEILIVL